MKSTHLIKILLLVLTLNPINSYANLDFKNALESACNEERCKTIQCTDPGTPPAGCTIKKNCCCNVVDCFNRGMDMGRVVSAELAIKLCDDPKQKGLVMSSAWTYDDLIANIEELNHCLIGSDCGILTGFSCCTKKKFFLINKKADLCLIHDELQELLELDSTSKCDCAKDLEIPKPRYLRCNRENKCTEKQTEATTTLNTY